MLVASYYFIHGSLQPVPLKKKKRGRPPTASAFITTPIALPSSCRACRHQLDAAR